MSARGATFMVASALGFSVMAMLVKVASATLPTGEIVFARAVITLVLSYAMVVRAGLSPWGHARWKLVGRGVLGFGGLTFYYLAVVHLPLADATTLQNLTPLVTAVLGWIVLRERVARGTAIALALGIAGVLLVVRPTGEGLSPLGVACGILAAMCSATAYVTVRKLVATEHPLVIVFYFPLIATPLAAPWAIADWVTPTGVEWLVLAGIGLSTQFAQVALTLGLQQVPAARATAIGYVQIVFAMGWQLLIWHQPPALLSIAGAALIMSGTFALTRTSPGVPRGQAPRPPASPA